MNKNIEDTEYVEYIEYLTDNDKWADFLYKFKLFRKLLTRPANRDDPRYQDPRVKDLLAALEVKKKTMPSIH